MNIKASKEEIKDDSITTDQIARNAMRKGIEERLDNMPVLPDTDSKKIEVNKMESQISTKDFIDKYDEISDEAIKEDYYSHFKFREKHEHKEEATNKGAVQPYEGSISEFNKSQYCQHYE